MRYGFVSVGLMLLLPHWAVADEIRFSYGVEDYYWEEFDSSDNSLLNESGLRHLISIDSQTPVSSKWSRDLNGHLFVGTVDYDGQDSQGDPVTTDTDYFGLGMEFGFSYQSGGQLMEGDEASTGRGALRLALGLEKWDRDLQGAGGYLEEYLASYGRVAGVYANPSSWRGEIGAKLPISTSEEIDLRAFGFVDKVTLNPKGRPSLYANVLYHVDERIALKLAYDGYLFDKSDEKVVYNRDGNYYAIHQPKSMMRIISLNLSVAL